eukprot:759698-Hanusia_phi.AAC.2
MPLSCHPPQPRHHHPHDHSDSDARSRRRALYRPGVLTRTHLPSDGTRDRPGRAQFPPYYFTWHVSRYGITDGLADYSMRDRTEI